MNFHVCPHCKHKFQGAFAGYCPACGALYESNQGITKEDVRTSLLLNEAENLMAQEEWREAIGKLIEIVKAQPNHTQAYALLDTARIGQRLERLYVRAEHCYFDKKWDQSVELLESIEEIQPGYRDVNQFIDTIGLDRETEKRKKHRRKPSEPVFQIILIILMLVMTCLVISGAATLIFGDLVLPFS